MDGEKISGNPEQLKRICHVKEADVFSTDTKVKDIFKTYSYFFENYDKENEERLVKRFGINTKKAYGKLSRGQKSAVTVTAALASNAEITIFDEPTTGLDVANRKIFYEELMEKYSEDMGTYIIITHQVGEIERIIEKLIIIDKNKIGAYEDVDNEPTTGLDVANRKIFYEELMEKYSEDMGTYIIISHQVGEIERIIEKLIIIDKNKIGAYEDVDNFKSKSNLLSGKEEDLKKLSFYCDSKEFKQFGSTKTIFYYGNISGDDLETIKEKGIEVGKAEFEDAFVTFKQFGSTKTIFYYGNISGDDLETIKEKGIEVGKAEFEDAFVTITKEVN